MAEQLRPGSSLLGRPDGPEFRRKSAAPRRPTMRRTTATPWASPSSQTRSRRSGSFHELVRFVMRCEHICERWRGVDVLGVVKFDLRRRLHTIILPISQSSIPPKIPRQLQFATSPLRSSVWTTWVAWRSRRDVSGERCPTWAARRPPVQRCRMRWTGSPRAP